jgi:hypothetical protein
MWQIYKIYKQSLYSGVVSAMLSNSISVLTGILLKYCFVFYCFAERRVLQANSKNPCRDSPEKGKPSAPKTNGMVERANGIIKSNTILREQHACKEEMKTHLMKFLVFYLLYRIPGSLKKELGVKTAFEAVEKWYELKPELFLETLYHSKKKFYI